MIIRTVDRHIDMIVTDKHAVGMDTLYTIIHDDDDV
jgi:hypothetical protein